MGDARKAYPSDVSDDEWAFAAPYPALMREDAPQREHALRDVFDALRWPVRTGAGWRLLPHDFPPWTAVDQQARPVAGQRRLRADRPRPAGDRAGAGGPPARPVG